MNDFVHGDYDPCPAYRVAMEHDEPVCGACGHLADDHERGATVLVMTDRRRARSTALPARRAS